VIRVSLAERNDLDSMVELLEEMDRYYGDPTVGTLDQRKAQIETSLFSIPPSVYALLARQETDLVGLASYSFLWPAAGVTRSLYLKELYVTREIRRAGIGALLMQHIFKVAADSDCSRVEWTTDRSNPDAQKFYESLGLSENATKIFFRATREDIARLTEPPAGRP